MSLVKSNNKGKSVLNNTFMNMFDAFCQNGFNRFWLCMLSYKRERKVCVHTELITK